MKEIHEMAVTGKTIHAAMGTKLPMPSWDEILILGAQLDPMPLAEDAQVNTRTIIGKHAKRIEHRKQGKHNFTHRNIFSERYQVTLAVNII